MATGAPESAGTGDYVKAPENEQPEVPVEEQLSQLKLAAKNKINEFADTTKLQYQEAKNDPANQASDEKLKQDVDTTAQDAQNSYNTALNQIGAARQQAQQRSNDALLGMQGSKSALQEGVAKVQNAFAAGAAVANQKLQESTTGNNKPATQSKGVGAEPQSPTLFQSLTNVVSQTAQSVKGAFSAMTTLSTTTNANTHTPTTTNMPVTHPPAETFSESVGQTAAAVKDAVKNTWTTPSEAQPSNNANPGLPADVPRKATE